MIGRVVRVVSFIFWVNDVFGDELLFLVSSLVSGPGSCMVKVCVVVCLMSSIIGGEEVTMIVLVVMSSVVRW